MSRYICFTKLKHLIFKNGGSNGGSRSNRKMQSSGAVPTRPEWESSLLSVSRVPPCRLLEWSTMGTRTMSQRPHSSRTRRSHVEVFGTSLTSAPFTATWLHQHPLRLRFISSWPGCAMADGQRPGVGPVLFLAGSRTALAPTRDGVVAWQPPQKKTILTREDIWSSSFIELKI
jgi:hypothetical protein